MKYKDEKESRKWRFVTRFRYKTLKFVTISKSHKNMIESEKCNKINVNLQLGKLLATNKQNICNKGQGHEQWLGIVLGFRTTLEPELMLQFQTFLPKLS